MDTARRRVVITGIGVVSPVGIGVEPTWRALVAGTSGGGPITHFEPSEDYPTRIACEVKGFDASGVLDAKEARRYDRFAQFALVATQEAMAHAGLEGPVPGTDPARFGVIYGSGIGGIQTFEEQCRTLIERGPKRVSPFFVPMFIPDIAAGLISIRWGLQGANYATVSACASSAHAIGEALRTIQRGDADAMVAGGTEATITPLTIAGFAAMKAMSTRNDDPGTASRPFCAERDGFVIGEGAGTVVLESLEHAEARGATPLAEVVGYGASADAYHITSPAPEHAGAQVAMRTALSDAALAPTDVDYINAHGTSTQLNDARETEAIKAVFGDHAYRMVVSSTKSMTGHLLGAAGGLEAAVSVKVCESGVIPPTINCSARDPECDLDYAHGGAVERDVRVVLSNSFGFGGHNVCLALKRWDS
ncbi:MAG: beta-ketoacyl-ACP synthase II [Gemmatimonadota bacterium]|nr:beta-ketoacyl-ACP synthase II [Gemmatimonadota bacterium]